MPGVCPQFNRPAVKPRASAPQDGSPAVGRWRGATCHVRVQNPTHMQSGVATTGADGGRMFRIPIFGDGQRRAAILMGNANEGGYQA